MAKEIVYDKSPGKAIEMLKLLENEKDENTVFLCPECRAELIVVLNWDKARKLNRHPGVYCTKDEKQVLRIFNIARD